MGRLTEGMHGGRGIQEGTGKWKARQKCSLLGHTIG